MYKILKKDYLLKRKFKIKKTGGRNKVGKITARHRGGGHNQKYYNISWIKQTFNNILVGNVIKESYKQPLNLYFNKENNELSLCSNVVEHQLFDSMLNKEKEGKINLLKQISIGSHIYNIEQKFEMGPIYCRSKFSFGQVLQVIKDKILIKLPSKKIKLFDKNIKIFLLNNLNIIKQKDDSKKLKNKAGCSRWLGRRPKVRGVAMNPVDHPHGGGEGKTSGGRFSCSPTGLLAKGYKTKRKKHEKI